jgi:hypothetical protein
MVTMAQFGANHIQISASHPIEQCFQLPKNYPKRNELWATVTISHLQQNRSVAVYLNCKRLYYTSENLGNGRTLRYALPFLPYTGCNFCHSIVSLSVEQSGLGPI